MVTCRTLSHSSKFSKKNSFCLSRRFDTLSCPTFTAYMIYTRIQANPPTCNAVFNNHRASSIGTYYHFQQTHQQCCSQITRPSEPPLNNRVTITELILSAHSMDIVWNVHNYRITPW